MNIVVCVKHAIDESELKVDSAGTPILQGAQARMSTFDRNAVEEAVRIKEAKGGSVTVVSLGSGDWKKSIKEALAMGCDRGVAVQSAGYLDALETAYYLARAISRIGSFDLVIFSEGASDTYQGLVGPMVAEWLRLAFIGYARKVELSERAARCEVALEDGDEVVEADLPLVLSVVSEVNTPRFPTLLQIMQASKKPLEDVAAQSLADDRAPKRRTEVSSMRSQPTERRMIIFEGPPSETAGKLAAALKTEGIL